jgi:2-methylcitrate dehydratase PrpD
MNAGGSHENTGKTVSERIVAFAQRGIVDETRRKASLHLVDWMGCAIAGRKTEAGTVFRAQEPLGRHPSPTALAFALGSLGSILEMDDVHRRALLHPGPVVMAAALAVAPEGAGRRFLDAAILGYEAMIRLGRSVGAGHYAFFHNTGTCGGIGSAMAAAHMLHLDDERRVWALGNAMTLAGGLWQCRNEPVLTKPLHVADAARRGVQAAVLAGRGLTGPRRIFEGSQGFFPAMARDGDAEAVFADAGSDADWLIGETSFKPWPACRHSHAVIDAALALRPAIAGRQIRSIRVESYADAILFCDRPAPVTSGEAKFSLQHACAVVFAKGLPEIDDFDPAVLDRPDYAGLRARTTVSASEQFTRAYPAHFGASVSVMLADGERLDATIPDALGDTENPMDEDAVLDKFHTLAGWAGLDRATRDALLAHARGLADGGCPARLRAALLPHL